MDSLFGALRDSSSSAMDTTDTTTVKRPTLIKVPSLTKVTSIKSLKKKIARRAPPKRRCLSLKQKNLSSEEKERIKLILTKVTSIYVYPI